MPSLPPNKPLKLTATGLSRTISRRRHQRGSITRGRSLAAIRWAAVERAGLQGEGPLLTIAQISVALAGFSSVVIALRGSGPHAWSPQDRFGLGNVLGASVGTLVGSLLPFPLTYLGWSNELVWGVVNATVGILILGAVGFLAFSVAKGSVPPRTPRVFWLFIASGVFVAGMLLLSARGLIFPRGPALLLFGLIWALVAAFAQLATFVLVTWSGRS